MSKFKKWKISRRGFMRLSLTGPLVMSGWFAGCHGKTHPVRQAKANPFVKNGKPLLVSVEGSDVAKMLAAGLEALGGLKALVGNAQQVVIKPNFVFPQAYPVTSDPAMIFALADQVRAADAGGVDVFDAPGTYMIGNEQASFTFNDVIRDGQKRGIAVTCGDSGRRRDFVATRKAGWQAYEEILVHKKIYNAPVVINTPTLKRHHTSFLTAALKNHFGAVYGPQRWDAHVRGEGFKKMGEKAKTRPGLAFRDQAHFMQALAEFADAVRPELTVVDARTLLIKGGPTRWKGKLKEGVNRLIMGWDMVAIDTYCSRLMEQHDKSYTIDMITPYLEASARLGLGTFDLSRVEVVELKV